MLTTQQPLSLQEFLALPDGETANELIDGQAIPKTSPKRFHSRLTGALCTLLTQWSQNQGEIGIEWAVVLKRHGKDWVPVPDLLYISFERLSENRLEDEACPILGQKVSQYSIPMPPPKLSEEMIV